MKLAASNRSLPGDQQAQALSVGRLQSTAGRLPSPVVYIVGFVLYGGFVFLFRPPCLFHLLTGMHCPGCGATRAVLAAAQGHYLDALHNNAWLWIVVLPYLGFELWYAARRCAMPVITRYRMTWCVCTLTIVFLVLRNLPVSPFSWLAPLP